MFEIHPQLRRDCFDVGRFDLCRLLLMNDSRYPWLILVPERAGMSEIYQLPEAEQIQLMRESCRLAQSMATVFRADKMNVAAIGNLVPQLHIHHIVRHRDDPAWPAPVWGRFEARPYDEAGLAAVMDRIRSALPQDCVWHAE